MRPTTGLSLLTLLALGPLSAAQEVSDERLTTEDQPIAVPWTDQTGNKRVKHLDLDQFMALIDITQNDKGQVAAIFRLQEQLHDIRVRQFQLLQTREDPDFDQVLWLRLSRQQRELADKLAAYEAKLEEHQRERQTSRPRTGYDPIPAYRVTGDPDRDRKRILDRAAAETARTGDDLHRIDEGIIDYSATIEPDQGTSPSPQSGDTPASNRARTERHQ